MPGSVLLHLDVLSFLPFMFSDRHPKVNPQTQDLTPYTLTQTEHVPENSVFVGAPGMLAKVQTHSPPSETTAKHIV